VDEAVANRIRHCRHAADMPARFTFTPQAPCANLLLVKLGDADVRTTVFQRDIAMARKVHVESLPRNFANDTLEFGLAYRHAVGFGGDHAMVHRRKDGRHFIAVTDVTGHGVAASMMVGRITTFLQALAPEDADLPAIATRLHKFIAGQFSPLGMFATAALLLHDPARRTLEICSAGHPPVIVRDGAATKRVGPTWPLLGIEGIELPGEATTTIPFPPGALAVIHTDGVFEARDPSSGRFLGLDALERAVADIAALPCAEGARSLADLAERHAQGRLADDALVAVLRAREG
jgi:serine phosphatase RsbU (regulator of sigma subunit)